MLLVYLCNLEIGSSIGLGRSRGVMFTITESMLGNSITVVLWK